MISSAQQVPFKPAPSSTGQPALPGQAAGAPSFAQFLSEQAPDRPANDADSTSAHLRRANAAGKPAGHTAPRGAAQAADDAAQAERACVARTARQNGGENEVADARTLAVDANETQGEDGDDGLSQASEVEEFTQFIGMASSMPPAPSALPEAGARADLRRRPAAVDDEATAGRRAQRATASDTRTLPGSAVAANDHSQAARSAAQDWATDRAASRAAAEMFTPASQTGKEGLAPTAPAASGPALPGFAAVLAQSSPTQLAGTNATHDAQVPVQAPLHSPAFASEVGTRVSLMAVDGIQQAELQLNPAEMGPVSVQIVVDGSQAQVSFHAVHAETRQALEQSLPDLAAALQGQGLTLSGGGVFQQARRDMDHDQEGDSVDAPARGRSNGAAAGSGGAVAASTPARRTVGLLDAFA